MAKKKKIEMIPFYIKDIDDFVLNNKVEALEDALTEVSKACAVVTKKGTLLFEGIDVDGFKSSYCSCTNIKKAHYTTVANIFRNVMLKSMNVYLYDDNKPNL